jgi:diphthine synthase
MSADRAKGKLSFIGLGLNDDEGVSLSGLKGMESADIIFAEQYTSSMAEGALDRLMARVGKRIQLLGREEVEDGGTILRECLGRNVAFLVVGDPMTATTHVDLRLRAESQGTKTIVIHGASVLTAVPGTLGLQHYKFGRTTTVPFPQEGFSPTSPYEVISENKSRGLHTLVLLDIDAENSRFMTANEGLHILLDMERRAKGGTIGPDTLACVVARAGSPDCIVSAGPISDLISRNYGPQLHSIVVPGKLHFLEEEALEVLAGKPKS